ncbi:MAG: twitching motility protein PilT [Clostridia bacterium]|nr:twitching motility protein PilT [Clostridia bacterium]
MIRVIAGNKGSGKTKRLIDITNDALKQEHGIVVFIDDDKRYMYDLRHEIRFVDASEYEGVHGATADVFLGFLSGMLSVNYDITLICIDAFLKLIKSTPIEETEGFFARLDALSRQSGCNFVMSVSHDAETLPPFVGQYVSAE